MNDGTVIRAGEPWERQVWSGENPVFCFSHANFYMLTKHSREGNTLARDVWGEICVRLLPTCKWYLKATEWMRLPKDKIQLTDRRLDVEKSQHFRRWADVEAVSPPMTTHMSIGLHEHLYVLTNIYATLTLCQAWFQMFIWKWTLQMLTHSFLTTFPRCGDGY